MADDPAEDAIVKRSVVLAGHATSVSLEGAFWRLLLRFAAEDGVSINRLIAGIDARRSGNLSSALRLYCVRRLEAGSPPPPTGAA